VLSQPNRPHFTKNKRKEVGAQQKVRLLTSFRSGSAVEGIFGFRLQTAEHLI
jgi:hypothetical protein